MESGKRRLFVIELITILAYILAKMRQLKLERKQKRRCTIGFEILYSYHERLDAGGYDMNEKKIMKKRVGDPFEEVCLDKCAGAIVAQMARRDILIADVEVYEVSKKKITFRESAKGSSFILRNKKYQIDGAAGIVSQDIAEAPPAPVVHAPTHLQAGIVPAPTSGGHPHNQGVLKPIKWVIFQPSYRDDAQKSRIKMLRFTIDKRYPVFAEQLQLTGVGMAYKTIDDLGREQLVSDEYFIPADAQLVLDRELRFSETPDKADGGTLLWGNAVRDDNTPVLRR